ncbi:hypothetical protein [Enterovibrio nigricans]|uniref:HNH endonuclease n=1 Tax=Enterovibrio nigricans DSM 22720 TaxID=1121868 RepID=A0A1T4UVU4_9GAMM|nr:hypothetical protein [Enterovibrio nigricans]SKA56541.1 hypothetical protein SAMN02745132_02579 [Enterovibrio nigricans DSM 22720]
MKTWTVEEAAKAFPVGSKVKYFPLLRDKSTFHEGEVRSEPWMVCGCVVISVTGKPGGLDVDHLELVK